MMNWTRVCAQVISDPRVAAGKKYTAARLLHGYIVTFRGFNSAKCALAVRVMKPRAVS